MLDLQQGLFSQEEYERLGTIRGRMGSSLRAFRGGGFGVWRARRQFHQMASELAFHRSRVERGMLTDPQTAYEREIAYLQHLHELRRRLGPY